MKNVVVLGSTGSIGTQTLDVIARYPDRLRIVRLAAGSNEEALRKQATRLDVKNLAVYAPKGQTDIPSGMSALEDLARLPEADIVVVSVAGVIGLVPTAAAIDAGKDIALASKEVLVAGGEWIMPRIREKGVKITPIDSEHSAIFQCLQGYQTDQISELILTASGGPFKGWSKAQLGEITPEQALNHPTWRMGGKITIDSATLMNKGLESIEAKWLFGVEMDQVDVVVHPQSIVHSFVKFTDGSVLGQLGWPNMRLPIAYALLHPERVDGGLPPWSPLDSPSLTFEAVDHKTFPSIMIAREAAKRGGTVPAAMNAANEEAANAFLRGETSFLGIADVVERVTQRHERCDATYEAILDADREARIRTREALNLQEAIR